MWKLVPIVMGMFMLQGMDCKTKQPNMPPPPPPEEELCVCPAVYSPVCGSNGQTYGNSCEAACESVSVAYSGPC